MLVLKSDRIWSLPLSGAPVWSAVPVTGPAPQYPKAFYDEARDRIVAFDGPQLVWTLDLAGPPTWTSTTPTNSPPSLQDGAIVYDSTRDRIVGFGGFGGNDTWAIQLGSLATWYVVRPGGIGVTPPPLVGLSGIFDPVTRDLLVFGGDDGDSIRTDVWRLSLETYDWSLDQPTAKAPARILQVAGFDPARRRMIAFDGDGRPGTWPGYDEWEYNIDVREWNKIEDCGRAPTGPAVGSHSWTFDTRRRRPLLLGRDGMGSENIQVWTYSSSPDRWCEIETGGTLPTMSDNAAVYDSIGDRLLNISGAKVWSLALSDPPTWSELTVSGDPMTAGAYSLVMDPVRNRVLVFGGFAGTHSVGELWELRLSDTPSTWRRIAETDPRVGTRSYAGIAFDAASNRLAIWGGVVYGGSHDDHMKTGFIMDLDEPVPQWVELPNPNALYDSPTTTQLVLDSRRRRFVLHGSSELGLSAVWALPVDGQLSWTRLEPLGALPYPGISEYVLAAYDPDRDELMVFDSPNGSASRLSWGDPPRPIIECPNTITRSGSALPVTYSIHNALPWSETYSLTAFSERQWPGYPISAQIVVGAESTAEVPINLSIPDTAAAGFNRLRLTARSTSMPFLGDSCEHLIGEPAPEEHESPLRLTVVPRRNPAGGSIGIELVLPTTEPVRLETIDVGGRVVARQTMSPLGPGSTRLDWKETQTLPSGVYLVRVAQSGATAATRVVIVR